MSVPTNILQTVQTYQRAELAWLLNSFYAIRESNKKFKNFNSLVANLGDTVTFDTTPRYIGYAGLVITQQPSVQRFQSLTCSQAFNVSTGYTDQQFIFNVENYMQVFGKSAMLTLGTLVESDILKNITSSVTVQDPQNPAFGTVQFNSGPYRFFGNGIEPINSSNQLAQMIANFKDTGICMDKLHGILPVTQIPAIIGNNLNQFAIDRNNENAMSWELGKFAECDWFTSNLLPTHISGTILNAPNPNNIMTIVSTNDPTGVNVTQITVTEPTGGTDVNAIKAGDLLEFIDGVAGQPNMRALVFMGGNVSQQPSQFRVIANAGTTAGTVTISIQTINGIGLVSAQNANQNINNTIQAGMKITGPVSHKAGLLHSGNQFYLAMPTLPDESPFTTSTMQNPESGATIRHYFGSQFGLNNRAYVRDEIHGSTLVAENSMRIIFAL